TVQRFIAEELAAPFGLDLYLGLPEDLEPRVAQIVAGDGIDGVMEEASQGGLSAGYANPRVRATEPNTRAWREAGVPAGGLHADALSLARLYSGLADGGMLGHKRLLGSNILQAATAERFSGVEAGFGWPMRFGAGFMLNTQGRFGPHRDAFGHTGWGGYMAFGDPDTGTGVAFVSNEMLPEGGSRDMRERLVLDPVFDLLATLKDAAT
ncbi:MAG: serine hydrolase, partial [Thalassobaculaceae bacterium]|nr:serine hydrolase [Thalassobaculaceae bacterium]